MPARSGWRNCKNKIGKYKKKITAVVSAILIAVAVFFPLKYFNEEYMKQALNVGTTSSAIASQLIYRLPTALRPLHYDLELIPDIYQANSSNFSFQGTVKIEFVCRNHTSDVILHAVDLTIEELDVQLRSWDPQDDPNIIIKSFQISKERETLELHLLRPLQEKYRYLLTVTFRGQITDLFRSMYFSSYQENNQTKYFVSTIFVPNHARLAFPCFDEPAFKARFTLTILRKENFISISNMPRNDTHERIIDGDVWFVDHFLTTPLMSTYLLTFTVCQFNYKEVNSSRGYKLRAWSRADSILETEHALDMAELVMDYYNDYFTLAFPLPEQELIALPGFQYAGMEHWGLVSYSENSMLLSEEMASINDKEAVTRVIAHETAHMWFGDLLTMAWWDDTWLNEGFATFVEYLGTDYASPHWKMMDQFLVKTFRQAMLQDSTETSVPLHRKVDSKQDILSAYNSIIYVKGASIIRMVKFFMGDETFKRGIKSKPQIPGWCHSGFAKKPALQTEVILRLKRHLSQATVTRVFKETLQPNKYLHAFQYSTATQKDLWETLMTEAEKDGIHLNLSDIMESWTVQNNYPVVMVTRLRAGEISVSQRRYLLEPKENSSRSHAWDIPFTFVTSTSPHPTADPSPSDVIWLRSQVMEEHIVRETIAAPDDEEQWILGNVGCYGFYRVNYDDVGWRALISQLNKDHQKIPTANRVQIISDSWNLAKAGLLNYSTALCTLEYLHNETSYLPWEAAASELEDLLKMLSPDDKAFNLLTRFMQNKTSSGFLQFSPRSGLVEDLDKRTPTLVAKTACLFDLPSCVSMATEEFHKWMEAPHNTTAEMRQVFQCTAIAHGTEKEWNFVFSRFSQERIVRQREQLLSALACSRNTTMLKALSKWALNLEKFQEQEAIDILLLLSSTHYGSDIVWKLMKDNFSNIMSRFSHTAFVIKGLISRVTETFRTYSQLHELRTFSAQHPEVADEVGEAIERTHANIQWMTTNLAIIEDWLIEKTTG